MSNDKKVFKERLIVSKELFYNESSMFGAYGFKFEGDVNPLIKVHPTYGNFSIGGNVQPLVEGKAYTINFKESFDERRQIDTYTFIEVESEGVKGLEANHEFIKAVLPEKQAKNIIDEYPLENELVKGILEGNINLTTIKGIKDATANNILNKLEKVEKYSKAIVVLAPLGASIKSVVKLAEYFGSPDKLLKVIESNIYSLTSAGGFGFKKVDQYALENGVAIDDVRRVEAGALYVIDKLVEYGDTKLEIGKFEEQLCNILDINDIDDNMFNQILNNKDIYYEGGSISLVEIREEEELIVKHLRRIRDNFSKEIKYGEIESVLEMNEQELGFSFNDQQRDSIKKAITSGVFILDGLAGSGKTSSLKTAIDIIDKNHVACALSGKAANVLASNGLNAGTIHRTLVFDPSTWEFTHDSENPLDYDIVILDEASMVDNKLFLKLISAVKDGSQLMIVGDSGQLPSIGRGAVFDYLLSSTEFSHTTLTTVHRQAQDSGTLQVANVIREGKQFNKFNDYGLMTYGNNKDLYSFGYQDKENILSDLLFTVNKYINNPNKEKEDLQVITGLKEKGDLSVVNLNKELQPLFNPYRNGQDVLKGKKYEFRINDRVIQQGNKYNARTLSYQDFNELTNGFVNIKAINFGTTQVFNGTFGYIVGCVTGYGMLVKFENVDGLVFFEHSTENNEIGVLDLGYAISCHRSQGSGFKTLFIALSFNDYMLLSRQFLYTALTRTINQCFLFAETSALHYAVKNDKGKTRKCFIGEFLK
ncbi:AAA family ATPase [Staphylococcus pseudoxylosus]|uniref:AAA family ATPase n=1 Tax=Staphylococcus pseudoxylosus TaxID=2282419 RepID=UPI00398AD3B0